MQLEHRLSALLQLHLHSRLNTWLQKVGQRRLQDETRIISALGFGSSYIRDFTGYMYIYIYIYIYILASKGGMAYVDTVMITLKWSFQVFDLEEFKYVFRDNVMPWKRFPYWRSFVEESLHRASNADALTIHICVSKLLHQRSTQHTHDHNHPNIWFCELAQPSRINGVSTS